MSSDSDSGIMASHADEKMSEKEGITNDTPAGMTTCVESSTNNRRFHL